MTATTFSPSAMHLTVQYFWRCSFTFLLMILAFLRLTNAGESFKKRSAPANQKGRLK